MSHGAIEVYDSEQLSFPEPPLPMLENGSNHSSYFRGYLGCPGIVPALGIGKRLVSTREGQGCCQTL